MSSLSILSLNTWCHYFVRAPNRTKRIKEISNRIINNNYDIICIQELFLARYYFFTKSSDIFLLINILKDNGYYCTDPYKSLPSYIGQNSGLLILSKYKIEEISSIIFSSSSITEYPNNKGFIYTTIEINNKKINIGTCHLDAHKISDSRLSQIKEISEIINKYYNNNTPIIISGDFNICPRTFNANEYNILQDEFKKYNLINITDSSLQTHISGATLDHIFISNHFNIDNISATFWEDSSLGMLSDHYAMEVKLILN